MRGIDYEGLNAAKRPHTLAKGALEGVFGFESGLEEIGYTSPLLGSR
jgi:hypothetical protein